MYITNITCVNATHCYLMSVCAETQTILGDQPSVLILDYACKCRSDSGSRCKLGRCGHAGLFSISRHDAPIIHKKHIATHMHIHTCVDVNGSEPAASKRPACSILWHLFISLPSPSPSFKLPSRCPLARLGQGSDFAI